MNAMCRWHMAATSSKTGCNLLILPPRAKSAIESYIIPTGADAYIGLYAPWTFCAVSGKIEKTFPEGAKKMKSYLIQDTTEAERRQIVEESLGLLGGCDECSGGLADMYDDYIYGIRELSEITMSFRTGYTSAMNGPERSGCGY